MNHYPIDDPEGPFEVEIGTGVYPMDYDSGTEPTASRIYSNQRKPFDDRVHADWESTDDYGF